MSQDKTIVKGFSKDVSTPTYENKESVKIVFTNRLNEAYDVIVEDLPTSEYHDTVADKVARALNPNVDSSTLTYGIARTLSPKTVLINKMRADIDAATMELYSNINKEAEAKQKSKEQPKQEQPKLEQSKQEQPKEAKNG